MTDPKHTEPVDLLPCPFCGGEAELRGFHAPEFWVSCPKVGCKASTEAFGSKGKAIAAWNTRPAAEAASRAREDALRGLIGDAYETLKRIEQGADEALVAAAAKEACDKIDAALSPAAKGGDHG